MQKLEAPTQSIQASDDGAVMRLCDVIRETSYALHHYLRHGHLEKVYENGLAHRLRKLGVEVAQQVALDVRDEDGEVLGKYVADLLVGGVVLVELKACSHLAPAHTAQLLGYMRACEMRHGMLLNFGNPRIYVRKFVL